MRSRVSQGAVFTDRDGTVIVDRGYIQSPEGVELLPNTVAGLPPIQRLGMPLIVVTNRSGVRRGLLSESDFSACNRELADQLSQHGVKIADFFVCTHSPEQGCECRKPSSGLFIEAARKYSLVLGKCYVVGDYWSDIEAAKRIGARSVLINGPRILNDQSVDPVSADANCLDLLEAAERIRLWQRSLDAISRE